MGEAGGRKREEKKTLLVITLVFHTGVCGLVEHAEGTFVSHTSTQPAPLAQMGTLVKTTRERLATS